MGTEHAACAAPLCGPGQRAVRSASPNACRQALAQEGRNRAVVEPENRAPAASRQQRVEEVQDSASWRPPRSQQLSVPPLAQQTAPACHPASQLADQRCALADRNERTLEVNDQLRGVLPKYVRDLRLQQPGPGTFCRDDVAWQCVEERKQFALAAAIPSGRLADFVAGEAERGGCNVQLGDVDGPGARRGACSYAGPSHKHEQEQQQLHKLDAPQPSLPRGQCVRAGYTARRGRLQLNKSGRVGCLYSFYVKAYSKVPNVVVVKFPCSEGDVAGSCARMRHVNKGGRLAHDGLDKHLRYTDEIQTFVYVRLKIHMKPALIMSGAPCPMLAAVCSLQCSLAHC